MSVTTQAMADPTSEYRGAGQLPRQWWTLIAVCASMFMLLVDITIVQVALPTIQSRFGSSFTDLQWVIDAYAVALAALILTWGSTSDRFGRKRVFIIGLSVFTGASLLCGLAESTTMLIWSRALQGVGGAAMFATGLALIGQEFHGRDRGKAIAAWGATVGVAVAIGPLVGGALTSSLGWRWIFIVNAPIGVVALWISMTKMTNQSDPGSTRLDLPGLVTFAAAMFLLEYALIRGNALGWQSLTILGLLAAALVSFVLFVVVELRQRQPMFDLSLFRKPGFTGVSVGTFAVGAGMFALLPYLTFYLQDDLGYSPLQGGLRLLPLTLLTFVVPLLARPALEKLPPGPTLGASLAIIAGGIAAFLVVSATSSWTALIPGMLLTGLGIGLANPMIARIGLGVVARERAGMASGISNTFRVAGLATGVAAFGAIFQQRVTASLTSSLGSRAGEIGRVLSSAGVRAATHASGQAGFATTARTVYVSGLRDIMVIAMIVVIAGAIASVAFVRARDFVPVPQAVPNQSSATEGTTSNQVLASLDSGRSTIQIRPPLVTSSSSRPEPQDDRHSGS